MIPKGASFVTGVGFCILHDELELRALRVACMERAKGLHAVSQLFPEGSDNNLLVQAGIIAIFELGQALGFAVLDKPTQKEVEQ